jgi:hypothetical protein
MLVTVPPRARAGTISTLETASPGVVAAVKHAIGKSDTVARDGQARGAGNPRKEAGRDMGIHLRARHAFGATALAVAIVFGMVSAAGAAPAPKYQVTVSDDFSSGSIRFVVATIPDVVEPGTYKVGLANNSIGPHVLIAVGGLSEDLTVDQFIELVDGVEQGGPIPDGVFVAGAVFSKPGQDHQKQFDLTAEGQYGYFCPILSPAGTPHYKMGFVGLYDVASPE